MTDYSLWEVILNGDSPTPTRIVDGVVQVIAPTTIEQRLAKKNELKARETLMMALPYKYQLKFNIHKDVKSLMEAIEKSTNESVSVVPSISAASSKAPVYTLPNVYSLSDAVIYSFFVSQSNSPQLDNEDLKQIDADDLEEIDLKWQMAMHTMRVRRFLQKTRRNLGANETAAIRFDMSKVECYNCHRRGLFARECRSPRDNRNKDTLRRTVPLEVSTSNALVSQCDAVGSYDWSFQADEEPTNYALMTYALSGSSSSLGSDNESQFDVLSYKVGLESVEARLVMYQENENVFEEEIKLLKLDVMLRDNALVKLRKKFEKDEKEKDDLKLTLEKIYTSLKNLSKQLESQVSDKTGLGYDSQVCNSQVFDCEESDDSVPKSPVNDRYKSDKGYHAFPPPYTRTFMPPKPDLVFNDALSASETVTNVVNVESSSNNPSNDMSKTLRPDAPIIEDWISDSKDETEIKSVPKQKEPSFVLTSEHVKTPRESVKKVEHPIQAENLSKMQVSHGLGPQKTLSLLFDVHGNPQQALKNKGVIDSGCSRHMTGNISFLLDFKEINEGYVAFGENPKGGKITGKGKIKIGKLDFDDVYFVKELKFNLFSVSQMCDKKNNVLFTDTECVVLSSDYKLPDENHVLLRVPKENKMYNVDLNNFCRMNGIKREFSVARTPQQNEVAERKNRTLIEAARTMLADSLLPIPFWAEAVNTDRYSMNYLSVVAGNQPNHNACIKENLNADPHNTYANVDDAAFDVKENENEVYVSLSESDKTDNKKHDEKAKRDDKGKSVVGSPTGVRDLRAKFEDFSSSSTNRVNAISTPVTAAGPNPTNSTNSFNTAIPFDTARLTYLIWKQIFVSPIPTTRVYKDHPVNQIIGDLNSAPQTRSMARMVKEQDLPKGKRAIGSKWVFRNKKDKRGIVIRNKAILVTQGHTQEEGINYDEVFAPVARIEAIQLFLAYASFMGFMVYQMDVKSAFLYGTIKEDVYVCQPPGFKDPNYPDKYALVINLTIYVSCIKQFWASTTIKKVNDAVQLQSLIDEKKVVVTKDVIRSDIRLDDADGVECLPNEEIFAELARMGYEKLPPKLTFYNAFFSAQWKFLIHTLVQCVSAKRTAWNEFSCSMASAVICLATGRKFNFSKYIFNSMVRNVDNPRKFLMYSRFLQVIINNQVDDLSSHHTKYTSLILTQKVFANMRRVRKGFSRVETPLFASMLVQPQAVEEEDDVEVPTASTLPSLTPAPSSPADQDPTFTPHTTPHALPSSPTQGQPTKTSKSSIPLLNTLLETCATLSQKVADLEQDKHTQALESLKLKKMGRIDQDVSVGYKMEHFRGMTYDKVRPIFERKYKKVQTLFKPDKDVKEPQNKRVTEETLIQESFKKLKAVEVSGSHSTQENSSNDPKEMSKEDVQNMLEIVSVFEFKVETLQVKEDLVALWGLVKEKFSSAVPKEDKEKALWVELIRLFAPNADDVFWKLQRHDIFMLKEKDYPLSNAVMITMLSVKLQVEEHSEMARDLVMKIFMEANKPKSKSLDTSSK
nr:putative ribonuclease H-like domain-containing protein [Tanacetum cinerariifolium]